MRHFIVGDLNVQMDASIDVHSTLGAKKPKKFKTIINTLNLVDIYREFNKSTKDFTFYRIEPRLGCLFICNFVI